MNDLKLKPEQLKHTVSPEQLPFETTEEVETLQTIIGQKRGVDVMKFGLHANRDGYNIYIAGLPGTGKTTFARAMVEDFAQREATLFDWCYVYNFKDQYKPKLLQLPVGLGLKLSESMEQLIKNLKTDIPRAFNEESYLTEKKELTEQFHYASTAIAEKMNEMAQEEGFIIQPTAAGIVTIPIIDGEPLTEEGLELLDEETIEEMEKNSARLQQKLSIYMNEIRALDDKLNEQLDALDRQVALHAAGHHLEKLNEQFEQCPSILQYVQEVKEDILKNIDHFLQSDEETQEEMAKALSESGTLFKKYEVNVLVHHEETNGAPVIIADNPTYYNLIGKVEYESRMGVMSTNFTKIKPGFLHEANGGYLIIQARDLLTKSYAWEGLKRALLHKELKIENIAEHASLVATTSLQPEALPLDVKVILIGNVDTYQMLYHYDEDFRKLFKIKVDFDVEMDASEQNIMSLVRFIHTHATEHNLLPFHRDAVARIIEYSMRLADEQTKLSTRFNELVELLYEADTWARLEEATTIHASHIQKTIDEKQYRNNLYEEKVQQNIIDDTILIETSGASVGQVNGLAVLDLGQYQFGKPTRITATTFVGESGIVNIERESELSGSFHNKGVYILSGYIGQIFAQQFPLSLTAHLAFEQSYSGVDGDSASSTELYALLSSLANVPIKQGLAVTGSVNQKGEVQPIGGVNEKIEGFFAICEKQGLTGEQGVLIPKANVRQLMLNDRVIEAVSAGTFHIYAIETIEQGIEILTGVPAGLNEDSSFEPNSIYDLAHKNLKKFASFARKNV